MSNEPHVGDTSPHDWKYVSEGGSTIVFSYAGPPHPHFDGTALRLRKGPVPEHDEPEKYEHPQLVREDSADFLRRRRNGRKGDEEEDGEPGAAAQLIKCGAKDRLVIPFQNENIYAYIKTPGGEKKVCKLYYIRLCR